MHYINILPITFRNLLFYFFYLIIPTLQTLSKELFYFGWVSGYKYNKNGPTRRQLLYYFYSSNETFFQSPSWFLHWFDNPRYNIPLLHAGNRGIASTAVNLLLWPVERQAWWEIRPNFFYSSFERTFCHNIECDSNVKLIIATLNRLMLCEVKLQQATKNNHRIFCFVLSEKFTSKTLLYD